MSQSIPLALLFLLSTAPLYTNGKQDHLSQAFSHAVPLAAQQANNAPVQGLNGVLAPVPVGEDEVQGVLYKASTPCWVGLLEPDDHGLLDQALVGG